MMDEEASVHLETPSVAVSYTEFPKKPTSSWWFQPHLKNIQIGSFPQMNDEH